MLKINDTSFTKEYFINLPTVSSWISTALLEAYVYTSTIICHINISMYLDRLKDTLIATIEYDSLCIIIISPTLKLS